MLGRLEEKIKKEKCIAPNKNLPTVNWCSINRYYMHKQNMRKLKQRMIGIVTASAFSVSVLALTACGGGKDSEVNATDSPANQQTENQQTNNQQEANVIYGEITGINESDIMLALGTSNMPNGGPGGRGNASGGAIDEKKRPEGNTPPDNQKGEDFSMITLTGEEKTITVNNESLLKRMNMGDKEGESVSLSDLKVGDILKITYDSESQETIQSIELISGSMRGGNGQKQDASQQNSNN